ncbi:MAG TPA: hypothetical protein VFY21_08440 [Xanthobacteraceae bacterium]|nr:hypothetical protein [Xanthobacteraceae bacterium]
MSAFYRRTSALLAVVVMLAAAAASAQERRNRVMKAPAVTHDLFVPEPITDRPTLQAPNPDRAAITERQLAPAAPVPGSQPVVPAPLAPDDKAAGNQVGVSPKPEATLSDDAKDRTSPFAPPPQYFTETESERQPDKQPDKKARTEKKRAEEPVRQVRKQRSGKKTRADHKETAAPRARAYATEEPARTRNTRRPSSTREAERVTRDGATSQAAREPATVQSDGKVMEAFRTFDPAEQRRVLQNCRQVLAGSERAEAIELAVCRSLLRS